jgi:hypothetical protein
MGDNNKYSKVRPQLNKFYKSYHDSFLNEPVSVGKIFILSPKNSSGFINEEIYGVQKFNTLRNNIYRYQFVEGLGAVKYHFDSISRLSKRAPIIKIQRPSSPLMINDLVDLIERLNNS